MRFRCLLFVCAFALPAAADEGLWLFSNFPKQAFQEKYKVEVTDSFIEHLRLASLRIGGASGAFVSARGLIVTNQRAIAGCLTGLSKLEDGFYAATPPAETRCPGLDAQVLTAIENVTAEVKTAAPETAKA